MRPCSRTVSAMANSNATSVREALMAELLQDVDTLVRRLEQVDEALTSKIDKATTDAAGKAFLAFKLNFEAVLEKDAEKLTEAGRYAAAQIGNQLGAQTAQLVAAKAALERKAHSFVLLWMGVAFAAGAVGGYIGAQLGCL